MADTGSGGGFGGGDPFGNLSVSAARRFAQPQQPSNVQTSSVTATAVPRPSASNIGAPSAKNVAPAGISPTVTAYNPNLSGLTPQQATLQQIGQRAGNPGMFGLTPQEAETLQRFLPTVNITRDPMGPVFTQHPGLDRYIPPALNKTGQDITHNTGAETGIANNLRTGGGTLTEIAPQIVHLLQHLQSEIPAAAGNIGAAAQRAAGMLQQPITSSPAFQAAMNQEMDRLRQQEQAAYQGELPQLSAQGILRGGAPLQYLRTLAMQGGRAAEDFANTQYINAQQQQAQQNLQAYQVLRDAGMIQPNLEMELLGSMLSGAGLGSSMLGQAGGLYGNLLGNATAQQNQLLGLEQGMATANAVGQGLASGGGLGNLSDVIRLAHLLGLGNLGQAAAGAGG